MNENKSMKGKLIMQSFAPLFLILFVKYFDIELIAICVKFFAEIKTGRLIAVLDAVKHPLFETFLLEVFCLIWVAYSCLGIISFFNMQTANFNSQGEALKEIEKIPDSGVTFFMTYVLPMAMDDLNTMKGLIVFCLLMTMLFVLMWKTNLYYQNPVLTVLGYDVFSFYFETAQMGRFRDKKCIGITRGKISEGSSIKRQLISDNVFLVYEESGQRETAEQNDE